MSLRITDYHFDGHRSLVCRLIDFDLIFKVLLQFIVAGKLKFDKRLIGRSDADLKVDWAASVINLVVYVKDTPEPDDSKE